MISDLAKVQAALEKIIAAEGRAHQDPAPLISVSALNQSSVDFLVRVWCDASDYLGLKFDLTRQVKETFDAEGIEIPFPTTTILTSKD